MLKMQHLDNHLLARYSTSAIRIHHFWKKRHPCQLNRERERERRRRYFLMDYRCPTPLELDWCERIEGIFFRNTPKFFWVRTLKNDGTGRLRSFWDGLFSGKESYKNGVWKGGIYMRRNPNYNMGWRWRRWWYEMHFKRQDLHHGLVAFGGVATYTAQQSWPEVWDQLDQKSRWIKTRAPYGPVILRSLT